MPAMPRRAAILAVALALVVTVPSSTLALFDQVKETSESTFTLLPAEGVVRARAVVKLVNQKKPTKSKGPCENAPRRTCTITTSYYIEGWGPIYTPPDAVDVTLSGKKVEAIPIGSSTAGSTWVARFPRLNYKKKQAVEVSLDLPDGGPGAYDTRVTDSYAHFCWYPETVDSGTARAVLPGGWEARSIGAQVKTEKKPDATIVSTTKKKLPGSIVVCTDAYDPAALVRSHLLAPGGQLITLDAWPNDPMWSEHVERVVNQGLPVLEHTIGSPMPFAALTLQEVARANDFGHPTDLDPAQSRLLLDEDFGFEGAPLSALARIWFADGSIADPWLVEGLALWAGLSVAGYACPEPGTYPGDGPPSLRDWSASQVPQRVDPMLPVWQAMTACAIVEEAADLIGPARMRAVIDSLREGTPRYGDPAGPLGQAPADWADWLDAVDELGLVPARVTDLGLAERALTANGAASAGDLAGRLSARSLYHDTLAAMDGTALPDYVEALMEDWAFEQAMPAVAEAKRVYDVVSGDFTLSGDQREALLGVFEQAGSPAALAALEQAVTSGV